MKKLLLLIAFGFGLNATVQAQDMLSTAKNAAAAAGFDVNNLTSGIMGKLGSSLSLTPKQTPGVTNAVTDFLTQKAGIMGLQQSNPTAYKSKFGSLFGGLKTKLGGILLKNQMNKFLGLKPKTNDATNVLSQLFF